MNRWVSLVIAVSVEWFALHVHAHGLSSFGVAWVPTETEQHLVDAYVAFLFFVALVVVLLPFRKVCV